MTSSSPDPYAPPTTDVDTVAPPSTTPTISARIAGAFLALDALVVSGGRALGNWRQTTEHELPWQSLVASVGPWVVVFVIDALLAIPLLLGSVRFRIVTWIRAGLGLLLSAAMTLLTYVSMKGFRPEKAQEVLSHLDELIARGALFGGALLLLVTTQPERSRTIVGVVCIVGYAWMMFG
jgi:hypothetical protein